MKAVGNAKARRADRKRPRPRLDRLEASGSIAPRLGGARKAAAARGWPSYAADRPHDLYESISRTFGINVVLPAKQSETLSCQKTGNGLFGVGDSVCGKIGDWDPFPTGALVGFAVFDFARPVIRCKEKR